MIKKVIKYKDFLGNDREKALYFALTETKVEQMLYENAGENEFGDPGQAFVARLNSVMQMNNMVEMYKFFLWLIDNSFGIIEDDGETFTQNEQVLTRFKQSAAFDAFWSELKEDQDALMEFFNGIFPESLQKRRDTPEFQEVQRKIEEQWGEASRG